MYIQVCVGLSIFRREASRSQCYQIQLSGSRGLHTMWARHGGHMPGRQAGTPKHLLTPWATKHHPPTPSLHSTHIPAPPQPRLCNTDSLAHPVPCVCRGRWCSVSVCSWENWGSGLSLLYDQCGGDPGLPTWWGEMFLLACLPSWLAPPHNPHCTHNMCPHFLATHTTNVQCGYRKVLLLLLPILPKSPNIHMGIGKHKPTLLLYLRQSGPNLGTCLQHEQSN